MSTETPESNQKYTSAQEFKKRRQAREQGEPLELPSGLVVKVRRPEIPKLIADELIPADLVQEFIKVQSDTSNLNATQLVKLMQFQKAMAKHALLEPKIVDEPNYDSGEISIDDLDQDDLDVVWSYVNGGSKAVAQFREQRDKLLSGHTLQEVSESQTE